MALSANPVMGAALRSFGGILLVLNEQRQIVAVNDELLRFLGCRDPQATLGLRPGEALQCVHAGDNPDGGCGTGRFCHTCGAAVAIVTSLNAHAPTESECLLTAAVGDHEEAFEFRVRSSPIELGGQRLLAVSLLDIRDQKRREALEAAFLHDLLNTASALDSTVRLLGQCKDEERGELLADLTAICQRLAAEIAEQRDLNDLEAGRFRPRMAHLSVAEVREVITHLFTHQDCARGKRLTFEEGREDVPLYTDAVLLTRALTNLVKNALEATPPGGEVRVGCEAQDDGVVFHVWNASALSDDVAQRVFQRYFSTKSGRGRGLGTYGARLIAERCLGGRVSFTSSKEEGTVFRLELPPGAPVL